MEKTLAGVDPVVILLTCPIVVIAVCLYILFRVTIGRKQ